jgi:hypothetical protein
VPGTHTRTVAEDRQDESPQPLPALLSSFGIAASIRTTAELVVSILLQPTHPPSESDQRRDEATWLLHQSQQGRRGRRHHLVIYIKVNRARENAGIIYIHQSHRSRRGRHVYMISSQPGAALDPQEERPCGHLSSEECLHARQRTVAGQRTTSGQRTHAAVHRAQSQSGCAPCFPHTEGSLSLPVIEYHDIPFALYHVV